jgi:general secretion pathway protein G
VIKRYINTKNYSQKQQHLGFTVVELLVVLAVLAILAAIVASAYKGTHEQARDTTRLNDITAIQESLQNYRAANGTYPASISGPYAGWDSSADTGKGFLTNLQLSGYMDTVPKDPTNTGPIGGNQTTGYRYQYYYYTDMAYLASKGCSTTRGGLAVLMVVNMESTSGTVPGSPGFSCTGRNFSSEGAWVWGDYDKVP